MPRMLPLRMNVGCGCPGCHCWVLLGHTGCLMRGAVTGLMWDALLAWVPCQSMSKEPNPI